MRPCWPSGSVVKVLDGSKYHGQWAAPYKKTKEGWWLVFLTPDSNSLYLLLDGEFQTACISWS